MDSSQTAAEKCQDYIRALEEERRKIQVFQRELPLCLQLVTSAIESVRQQMGVTGQETVNVDRPLLEEFILLKPSSSSEEEDDRSSGDRKSSPAAVASGDKKPDWLKSVQLWNQSPEATADVEPPRNPVAMNVKKSTGAFQPFERHKYETTTVTLAAATTSSTTSGSSGCVGSDDKKEKDKVDKLKDIDNKDKDGNSQAHRKMRRCWSPELHRRFLHALQQLGGSHVATPKQIRELMKVDGLTNDEVKSHLQIGQISIVCTPEDQILQFKETARATPQLLSSWWSGGYGCRRRRIMQQDVAGQTGDVFSAPTSEIYAPVASLPLETTRLLLKNKNQSHRSPTGPLESEERRSGENDNSAGDDDDATHSASHSTSSSSRTMTTTSPPRS